MQLQDETGQWGNIGIKEQPMLDNGSLGSAKWINSNNIS